MYDTRANGRNGDQERTELTKLENVLGLELVTEEQFNMIQAIPTDHERTAIDDHSAEKVWFHELCP